MEKLSCEMVGWLEEPFSAGGLNQSVRAEIKEHLEGCAACRKKYDKACERRRKAELRKNGLKGLRSQIYMLIGGAMALGMLLFGAMAALECLLLAG
ncbi:MAG: hypothetical protein J5898_10995 [Lachnospiraceae bacterium]|nr:hypothetical protein [Lachnospiraceae bacterium]